MGNIFLIAFSSGLILAVCLAAWSQRQEQQRQAAAKAIPVHALAQGIDVSAQLPLNAIAPLTSRGYSTVIDLRPDGEAADEPSSGEMAKAAQVAGIAFHYVPVPHGEIPESAVLALRSALAKQQGPVLLYCRSGKRAARTWALVEAGRTEGLSADQIIAAVHDSGQDAQDLRRRIDTSIAARAALRKERP